MERIKYCVPVTAETKYFLTDRETEQLICKKKQYLFVLACTVAVNKCQGGNLEYILGDLNCATDKVSCAVSCSNMKLINFEPN